NSFMKEPRCWGAACISSKNLARLGIMARGLRKTFCRAYFFGPAALSPPNGHALSTSQAESELATLPTFSGFSRLTDTPDGNGTGILQATPEGNQEAAVRNLAQACTAHLPPGQRRCLGSGEGGCRAPPCLPIPYPGGNRPEG